MIIKIFDFIWLYFFFYCLFGFRIDTSRLPFTIFVRFFPTDIKEFWYCNDAEYDFDHDRLNDVIFLTIPHILDFSFWKER